MLCWKDESKHEYFKLEQIHINNQTDFSLTDSLTFHIIMVTSINSYKQMKKSGKETCFRLSKQTSVVYSEGQAPSSYTVRESTFFDLAVCVSEPVHGSRVLLLLAR